MSLMINTPNLLEIVITLDGLQNKIELRFVNKLVRPNK